MVEPAPTKPIFQSKTAIFSLLVAIAGASGSFFPDMGAFISSNSELILLCIGVINFALRLVTNGKVTLINEQ